jgi:DNA polymerase I-like protein with 3'-5' exonuclease and polymerase domains
VQIENESICAFRDMHLHGQRIDRDKWLNNDKEVRDNLVKVIEELDRHFIPLVGDKRSVLSDEELAAKEAAWKALNEVPEFELEIMKRKRREKNVLAKQALEQSLAAMVDIRKKKKDILKEEWREYRRQKTAHQKLVNECEGQALINYGSPAQLYKVISAIPGLKTLEDTNDKSLKKFEDKPIVAAIQKYREYSKLIGTYGTTWTKEWLTHPCKEEGWLWPHDGRLHPDYNQLDAETGRSTSEQPNGQNLPKQEAVRSCFVADPPDEEEPDGYVIVTSDMSGAELRIIAELANAETWIQAFARGEDVHSVGTEILYPEKWPLLQCLGGEKIIKKGKEIILPPCAYYKLKPDGTPYRQKCECPEHKALRDKNKSINFKIAYGGVAYTLAADLLIPVKEAQELMDLHESKFPDIWAYLEKSGEDAFKRGESRDMFGRRRIFPKPTYDKAKEYVIKDVGELIEFAQQMDDKQKNSWKRKFYGFKQRAPNNDRELFEYAYGQLIKSKYASLCEGIKRQGKNHCIQGTNASIAKIAMGCGFDPDGKPYLWHTLPQYKAKLLAFVHDELVIQCPKRFGEQVAALVGDAFKRAAAERMKRVVMEFDYHIANCWQK